MSNGARNCDRRTSILFSTITAGEFASWFLPRLKKKWGKMILDIEFLSDCKEIRGIKDASSYISSISQCNHVIFYAFKNAKAHVQFHDDNLVDLSAIYPTLIELHVRRRGAVNFSLGAVDELESEPKTIGTVEPYVATLCSPSILEITLIISDQLAKHRFADWIVTQAIQSCLRGDEGE